MRYRRAVEKLRILAEAGQDFTKRYPSEEPVIKAAYVFGEVLRGADWLRLSKGGYAYFWRSHLDPDLPRVTSTPEAEREQAAGELATALSRLRSVHASYWDDDWRRENRGAVEGYLDLLDASREA